MCETLESGIGAVFGSSGLDSSNIVQSLCETMEVPRIETSLENTPIENYNYYFNPYPEPTLLAKVKPRRNYFVRLLLLNAYYLNTPRFLSSQGFTAIVHDMDWSSFTLLYQRPESLYRLQDLIQDYSGKTKPNDKQTAAISVVQLPESNNFRYLVCFDGCV